MTNTTKPELKPCPFCGGPAELKQTGRNRLEVRCRRCVVHKHQITKHYSLDWLEDKMIEGWNTRAPQWQPIETAPTDTMVLVWADGHDVCAMADEGSGNWTNYDFISFQNWPTHWRPLPEGPEVE